MQLSKRNKDEISMIRDMQTKLYSNMDRFTTQVILTYMSHSPMSLDAVYDIQKKINSKVTKNEVKAFLEDLIELDFATRGNNENEYEYTKYCSETLKSEGITKDYLFSKST